MATENPTYALIHRMKQAEKTYFKKFARLHTIGGENNYVELFDALAAMKSYNEEELKVKFEGRGFAKQIRVANTYLYKMLLKSLRRYYDEKTPLYVVRNQLREVGILFDKGLYKECQKILRKCRKTAEAQEMHMAMVEILVWEFKLLLMEKAYNPRTMKPATENYRQRELMLQTVGNVYALDELEYKLSSIFSRQTPGKRKSIQEDAKRLLENQLLQDEEKCLSSTAQLKFNHIFATHYYMTGQAARSREHLLRELAILESKPYLLKQRFQDYLLLTNNAQLLSIELQEWDGFEERARIIDELLENDKRITSRLFTQAGVNHYIMSIRYFEARRSYTHALETNERLLKQIEKHQARISPGDLFSLWNLMSHIYFKSGDFSKALEYSRALLNHEEASVKYTQYPYARIFNLLIHYELENTELLDYAIESVYRERLKHDRDDKLAKTLIKHLRKLTNLPLAERPKEFNKLQQALHQLKKEEPNRIFKYFDFEDWAKQHAGG